MEPKAKAKAKAKELVDKFMPYMYCYMGSGMLSNDYDINVALSYAKKGAIIAVTEMLENTPMYTGNLNPKWDFYNKVKKEVELLQV